MLDLGLTVPLAFVAGLLSFLSPCILPVIPSFLAYMSGVSFISIRASSGSLRRTLLWSGLLFSLGFLAVFLTVGASIGFLGQAFVLHQRAFQVGGGILIILLGFSLMGVFRLGFLQREYKFKPPRWLKRLGVFRPFGVGVLFSFGWAPCYGPITGAILTLVALEGSTLQGLWLFLWYSLGFILPLLLICLFLSQSLSLLRRFRHWIPRLQILSGLFVILLGILLITNHFRLIVDILTLHIGQSSLWEFN